MMEEGYCALTGNGKLQLFKNLTLFVVVNPKCGNFSFQDFFVVQILREINFGRCRSSKKAILAIFGGSDFGLFGKCQP